MPNTSKKEPFSNYSYLEVGAGNFSGAHALAENYSARTKALPGIMTLTDLVSVEEAYAKTAINMLRLANLKKMQYFDKRHKREVPVKLLFSVDATKLESCHALEGRYHRIQFNMPQNLASFKSGLLQQLIADFFKSAAHLQKTHDKIYLTLPEPLKQTDHSDNFKSTFYYQCYYNLYQASTTAGYKLYKKRKFLAKVNGILEYRYPGYIHMKTADQNAHIDAAENIREFVFIKTDQSVESLISSNPPQTKNIWKVKCLHYPAMQTDSGSDDQDFAYLAKECELPAMALQSQDDQDFGLDTEEYSAKRQCLSPKLK